MRPWPNLLAALAFDDTPRDITGPEFVSLPVSSSTNWVAIAVWAGALIAAAVLVLRVCSVKSKSRRMRAGDRALSQLDRLRRQQLLSKNRAERHFTLLAGILRRYVEKTTGLRASRLTTAEFVDTAAKHNSLEPHLGFLRDFLGRCDLAKFAPPAAVAEANDLEDDLRAWLTARNRVEPLTLASSPLK